MLCRAVARMALESIPIKASRQTADECIPGLLGQNTGRSDGSGSTVPCNNTALWPQPRPKRKIAIHQNQPRGLGQSLQSPQHGAFSGNADATSVNFSR